MKNGLEVARKTSGRAGALAAGTRPLSEWSAALRVDVRANAAVFSERVLWLADGLRRVVDDPYLQGRVAKATHYLFDEMPIRIRHGERLAGWHPNTHADEALSARIAAAQAEVSSIWPGFLCEGHMAPDYPTAMRLGLGGISETIAGQRDAVDPAAEDGPRALAFLGAAAEALSGLQALIRRYAALAASMAGETTDPKWRRELEEIRDACAHVAEAPPSTFREAIQLTWFIFLAVAIEGGSNHGCFGPGRMDQYLYPYYEAALRDPDVDEELLDDLIAQLFIKCNEFERQGMSAVILVAGGRRPDGTDATNDLSYKLVELSDRVHMYFPGIDISWHSDIDPDFMRHCVRLLRNRNGQPSFFNSDTIIRGLVGKGVLYEHAVDHLPSTCTETSIMGRSNPHVAWPYVNLAMVLDYALFGGRHPIRDDADRFARDVGIWRAYHHEPLCPDVGTLLAREPQTYEELCRAFFTLLEQAANGAAAICQSGLYLESIYRPFPLLSCFIDGCLRRATNISDGGALYNFIQPEAVGVSNVVDSLAAVKVLVEDKKRYSLDDFRAAIRSDYQGHEALLKAVRRQCPKHGNDVDWVNKLFADVAGGWCANFERRTNVFGGPFLPGFLGWTVWIGYGEETPATLDGRLAAQPLANSLANCTGVDVKGFPSVILSASGFDQSRGLGGTVFNIRFQGEALDELKGIEALKGLIEGAMDVGCYQIQVNVIGSETLREAQENPDRFPDLFVRIGGYLVPFIRLPLKAQEEVIARTALGM